MSNVQGMALWRESPAFTDLQDAMAACGIVGVDPCPETEADWPAMMRAKEGAFQLEWSRRMRARAGIPERATDGPSGVVAHSLRAASKGALAGGSYGAVREAVLGVLSDQPAEAMTAAQVIVALNVPRGDAALSRATACLASALRAGLVRRRFNKSAGEGRRAWAYWRAG